MRVMLAFCAIWFGGCVTSNAVVCGDSVCPADFVCTTDRVCVASEAITMCDGKADGIACTVRGVVGECVSGICSTSVCGNRVVEIGEVCDEGDRISGDGCDSTCRSLEVCGNGIVDIGEMCDCGDSADNQNDACTELNSLTGSCRPDCTPVGCGDGVIQEPEQCEESSSTMTVTCEDLGYYVGTPTCNDVCRATHLAENGQGGCTGTCGDGTIDFAFDEVCEGTPPGGQSCLTYGFDRGPLGCSTLCRPDFADCGELGWVEFAFDNRGFMSVFGLTASHVWAGGSMGAVLQWDGTTWVDRSLTTDAAVRGVWLAAMDDVYLATDGSSGGEIHHRTGSTWTSVHTSLDALNDISGSGTRMIAVGRNGYSVTSTDGTNWSPLTYPNTISPVDLRDVHVISPTLAYAVGGGRDTTVLLQWTGGSAWTVVNVPQMDGALTVWGRTASDLYVGGGALLHWDGTSWSTISVGIDADVLSVAGTATDVFVSYALTDGTVAQFDGQAWAIHDVRATSSFTRLWAAPTGEAFASSLRMSRYVGSGWTTSRVPSPITMRAVGGTPGGPVFAVGDRGYAMMLDGASWRRIPTDMVGIPRAASGNVIVGDNGLLATFDGTRITTRDSETTVSLRGVWAYNASGDPSDGHAWAVGESGTIVHFDGTNAQLQDSGTSVQLNAIWGATDDDIFAVGESGTIRRYGSGTWNSFASTTGTSLTAIWGLSVNNFVVLGPDTSGKWNGSMWVAFPALPISGVPASAFGTASGEIAMVLSNSVYTSSVLSSVAWASYTAVNTSTGNNFVSVGGDGTTLYGATENFGLMRRVGTDWAHELHAFTTENPFSSIYAAGPADVYGSSASQLAHFDGYAWTTVRTPIHGEVVTGSGPSDVWLVARKGTGATHWNGSTWTEVPRPARTMADYSAAGGRVFGAGPAGALQHYDAGWTDDTSGTITTNLNNVHAASQTSAFAVGAAATVIEWNGSSWATVASPPGVLGDLAGVWSASANEMFVGGTNALARRSSGTWSVEARQGRGFTTLIGTSANDVFAAAGSGLLEHYDGTRWSAVETGVTSTFVDSTITSDQVVFSIQGTDGAIRALRRDVAW